MVQTANGVTRAVVDDLRTAISTGDLAPGQRLVEADLVQEFGAARGEVRTALVQLEAEGLIERERHRGARVRRYTLEEALEIVELRSAIESMCAARAAANATPEDLEDLKDIGEQMVAAVAAQDPDAYSVQNQRLHMRVLEASRMRVAPEIVRRLRAQNVRHRIRLAQKANRPIVSLPEHLRIIDAIARGDEAGAADAMRIHLQSVAEATRGYFSN
ncbi:GntR family transcriptional regulator [Gulosibacter faecalis]|jgi:DNA-binding GntR family transcriptional regulator|uniref:GntR family transcriptional regulator n=1 Tax=Gulosibacter faecalis TaxID=272240 RepID=A0ABW5UYM1_9MICO|nr:GntR family transcriptional regulator [Gulosibacter faecalis]